MRNYALGISASVAFDLLFVNIMPNVNLASVCLVDMCTKRFKHTNTVTPVGEATFRPIRGRMRKCVIEFSCAYRKAK